MYKIIIIRRIGVELVEIGAGKYSVIVASPLMKDSNQSFHSPFKTWQRVYDYDLAYNLTEVEAKNVLGGEVALWAEQTDETTLDVRLW